MNITKVRNAIRNRSIKELTAALAGERLTAKQAQSDLLERAILAGKAPLVAALLAAGADANYGHKKIPPLHVACDKGQVAIVDLLIAHGANVHAKHPKESRGPLHSAVAGGPDKARAKIVKSLLAAGAKCNDLDDFNRTALHDAAVLGSHLDVVQLLIDAGTNLQRKDNFGENALEAADRSCLPQIVKLLKKHMPTKATRSSS